MSLRLIYGKIGSGKTSFCIREALESEKRIFFVTPEQYTFTAEKRICSLVNVHGLGGVEVLSLARLADKVLSVERGAALPRLDSRSKAILLQKILVDNARKLSTLAPLAQKPGAVGELGKLFGEMKRYAITGEMLRKASETLPHMAAKLSDLALLLEAYNKAVETKFLDRDDDLYRFIKVLPETDALDGAEIYLDRFDGFDASEFEAIRALLLKGIRITVTVCYAPEEENSGAFTLHARMVQRLLAIAKECGAGIEKPLVLKKPRGVSDALTFLEENYFTYPTKEYENAPEGLRLVIAQNPLSEVQNAARRILKLCREKGYLYRDIAVTARDVAGYERYIEAVFPSYGIPFFMDRTIHILEHPFTVFVLSALELITKGYTYESMFRYVKSGFLRLPREQVDALENYVLATGIRGDIWKKEEKWNLRVEAYSEREGAEETEEVSLADAARRKIMAPLLRLEANLKSGKSAAEKCEAIYCFLEDMKVKRRILALSRLFEKAGEYASAAEYRGVYNDFIDALDGVCDAFGEEEIGVGRLYEVLRTALGEVKTGFIPAAQDGISVGSIDRIKGYAVKALLVLGVEDGVFPAPLERGGLLNDMERMSLSQEGLSFKSAENQTLYEEEHLIYKCITIPSEILEMSYPAASMEGAAVRPSRIWRRMEELFPKIEERNLLLGLTEEEKISVPEITLGHVVQDIREGTASDEIRAAYGWLLENEPEKTKRAIESLAFQNKAGRLAPETIKAFMGSTAHSSVSRLEKMAACPFSHFAAYVLNAKERKIMQPAASDAGRFLHDFMELFGKRLLEHGKAWQAVDEAYIEKEFAEIVPLLDRRLSPYMLETSPRYAQLFARLRRAAKTAVGMVVSHMQKCAFEPLGYELSFAENGDLMPLSVTLPTGQKLKLVGRIDRAEALKTPEGGTLVRILDYKSGAKTFRLGDVYEGLNLQLAVYLSALCAPENACIVGENARPAGILYFRLIDPLVDASPKEEAEVIEMLRRKEFKLDGLVLSDENVLRAMDADIDKKSGIIPAGISASGISGNVASGKQFEVLSAHVQKTVKKLVSLLMEGKVDIAPYRRQAESPCTYCKFSAICRHDGSAYRELTVEKADEVWAKMEAEV